MKTLSLPATLFGCAVGFVVNITAFHASLFSASFGALFTFGFMYVLDGILSKNKV